MKIRKYNENTINFSFEDLILNYRRLDALLKFDKECKKLMLDYLILNPNLQEDPELELDMDGFVFSINMIDSNNAYYGLMKKNTSSGKVIEINYWIDANHDRDELLSAWLSEDDVKDFIEYVKNPELYRSTKKFNV